MAFSKPTQTSTNGYYDDLWRTYHEGEVLERRMAELVGQIYERPCLDKVLPHYDAILVDEGQDFRPLWWQSLLKSVGSGGEKLLVADKTQDVYKTARAWTDQVMAGAGFRGEWFSLTESYRLPPDILPILRDYADEFLKDVDVDIPEYYAPRLADSGPVELRWVQTHPEAALNTCVEEVRRQMQRLRNDTAIADIVFLSGNDMGLQFVEEFGRRGVRVLHTFAHDGKESQRRKLAFFQGVAKVKATTLHSFKGWESRHLVLHIECRERNWNHELVYAALTRLKAHPAGSALTVVCSCPDLYSFGNKWPDFVDNREDMHAMVVPVRREHWGNVFPDVDDLPF